MKNSCKLLLVGFLLCAPALSHAYVGPGAGLSAIGSILAFIGTILLLIIGFFWYPIKRLIKSKKKDVDLESNVEIKEKDIES